MLESILKIIKELQNDSSRTGKEKTLKSSENNELFMKILKFVYNPFIITGLSTKKINKKVKLYSAENLSTVEEVIKYLSVNNTGKDADIAAIQRYLDTLPSDEMRDMAKQIFTKDLKVGLTSNTINKVFGEGTIPSFSVMLAEPFDKKEHKVTGEFYLTLKLDGNRCVAIVDKNEVKFFTRKGKPIEGMTDLENQFKTLPSGVYDGEILSVNKDVLVSDELFRVTQKAVRKKGVKKDLEFHIFDVLSILEFKRGRSINTYNFRRETLDCIVKPYTDKTDNIFVLPVIFKGRDKEVIPKYLEEVEKQGFEGLMVNTADGLYLGSRTDALLKVKTMKTSDLLVVNIEEAIDGQFEGLLGRINVEYKGCLVGCGSGFTAEDRKLYKENPELIVGKIVEVQHFGESKDEKTKEPSLRFPVFKGIRHDKTVEDINYE